MRTEQASAPALDHNPAGRLRSTGTVVAGFARRIPASVAFVLILVVTAWLAGTIAAPASLDTGGYWAAGVPTTIDLGHWWSAVTTLFIPEDPLQLVAGVLLALTLLGIAEVKLGSWRVIVAFVVTGVVGVTAGVLLQWAGSLAGEWWATGTSTDLTLDPLTGVVGALLAATAAMSALWRRRTRVIVFAFLLVFVLYDGDSSNVYRLLAAVCGLFVGAPLTKEPMALSVRRSSYRETRTLIATVVAITAVGPIVSLVNGSALTPFSFISSLFESPVGDADAVLSECADTVSAHCDRQLALLSAQGPGLVALSFLPLVLLVLAAWGLKNGRRFALILAIVVNVAIAALAWFSFDLVATVASASKEGWSGFDIGEGLVWTIASLLLPIAIVVVLVLARRHFEIRAPRHAIVKFTTVALGSVVVLPLAYFVTGLVTLDEYVPDATPADLVIDTVKRFIPVQFIASVDPIQIPAHDVTFFLYQLVGPLFWVIFIAAAVPFMSATEKRGRLSDRARLQALLEQGNGGSLGFMATWPGNTYWFSDDGLAAVAYRVINGVAITMSDPVSPPARDAQTIREFATFCDANNWTPVFYSVHDRYLPVFTELGWQHMSVGEETVVVTTGLELAGKPWQKVRQALNRGVKEGLTTVWTSWHELPRPTIAEINAISEEWVSEKEIPEMGFTLGGMDELKDPEVRLMLALGTDGRMQAVTSWLPSYRDGVPIGWTIDFMRRAGSSMNGVMEFLIASAALHMKESGAEFLSLSGAPLASKPEATGDAAPPSGVMTKLLDWLGKTLEPAYGFTSLFRFKQKFNPEYHTISMAYPDPLALPAIGIAVGRAYLPHVSAKEAVALVRTLTKSD